MTSRENDEFLSYNGVDRVVPSAEFRELNKSKSEPVKFKTGFPGLDKLIDGVMLGELIVVSGPTKHGKSTLCLTLARNLEKMGHKTLWFSFEMPADILLCQRYKDLQTHVPLKTFSGDMKWIKDRIIEGYMKFGTRIVFLDHLHFVADIFRMRNPSLEIGVVMRSLKSFAVEQRIVIFLVAHTGKLDRENMRPPSEQDIRDSSFITQEADGTLMVHRFFLPKSGNKLMISDSQSQVIVCNHRRTGVMGKKFVVEKKDEYYQEVDSRDDDNEPSILRDIRNDMNRRAGQDWSYGND
jgi:replicative DNA helicase